jgi:hypothetical protein
MTARPSHRFLPARLICAFLLVLIAAVHLHAMLLIPMDDAQTDHLKAYGIVYKMLKNGVKVYWLLNYRGGSFAAEVVDDEFAVQCRTVGVTAGAIGGGDWGEILGVIQDNNMEKITLEKAPRIAVYAPPEQPPWDDAVTLALTYADIPYDRVYDKECVTGKLSNYDWLHLHHEDFTGQYSKMYANYGRTTWYLRQKADLERIAADLGFKKVSECKKAVALAIHRYVENGGFLFAMCCATNTLDDALAALGTDIVDAVFDGDGVDPHYREKLNYANCFAFENFEIEINPLAGNFDNIDVNMVNTPRRKEAQDFTLFDFSAKLDPVLSMLVQDHRQTIKGYCGLTTSFNRKVIKKSIVVLADVPGTDMANYLHGVVGKGQFAFLGGHDPEDYQHLVGSKPTMLELHRNSPGYRLILNNVLFPAAEKKEKKT